MGNILLIFVLKSLAHYKYITNAETILIIIKTHILDHNKQYLLLLLFMRTATLKHIITHLCLCPLSPRNCHLPAVYPANL